MGRQAFYFDRRKCIQVVNFASKFTLFLVDVKKENLEDIPDFMMTYIYDMFADDKEMTLHGIYKKYLSNGNGYKKHVKVSVSSGKNEHGCAVFDTVKIYVPNLSGVS